MKIINYLKGFLWVFLTIIVLSFLVTLLHYFNILSGKGLETISLLVPIIGLLLGSIFLGRRSRQKGWLEGIKFGAIYLVIILLFSLLFFHPDFSIKIGLYYVILLLTAMLGSMIGINFPVPMIANK